MKTIDKWPDLIPYGIDPLTSEACGLSYRLLCDLTEKGKKILEKCLDVPAILPARNWNRGTAEEPHVGSVLLPLEMLTPLGVFALLESGCTEVWLYRNGGLLGIEPSDTTERIELCRKMCPEALVRTFGYRGTAGDRNVHVMSGRVQRGGP